MLRTETITRKLRAGAVKGPDFDPEAADMANLFSLRWNANVLYKFGSAPMAGSGRVWVWWGGGRESAERQEAGCARCIALHTDPCEGGYMVLLQRQNEYEKDPKSGSKLLVFITLFWYQ